MEGQDTKTIRCDIVSARKRIFSGRVNLLVASGSTGELGIYPMHAPLMTTLKAGSVRILKENGEEVIFFVGGGILEVMPHMITVLADTAIRADNLDQAAAQQAKEEAERVLSDRTTVMEMAEAEAKLAKALIELEALEEIRKRARR